MSAVDDLIEELNEGQIVVHRDDARRQAEDRAMADWSQAFREENSAEFPDPMELQGVIDSNLQDWREQWRAWKPKLTIVGRNRHIADLRGRIATLQRDLRMFGETHGREPDLDQKVIEWLKTVVAERE
jgi:hypothetical protein